VVITTIKIVRLAKDETYPREQQPSKTGDKDKK
jgi:hypothetical protein